MEPQMTSRAALDQCKWNMACEYIPANGALLVFSVRERRGVHCLTLITTRLDIHADHYFHKLDYWPTIGLPPNATVKKHI